MVLSHLKLHEEEKMSLDENTDPLQRQQHNEYFIMEDLIDAFL